MDSEKIKSFWNDVATSSSHKDKKNSGMLGPATKFFEDYRQIQEEEALNKLVDISKIKTVLEVGCGGGRWSFYFSDKVESVKGIDISSEMIKLSKSIAKERNIINVDFEEIDFLELPENTKYDLVYFSGVLQYIEDDTIKQIIHKLKDITHEDSIILSRDSIQDTQRVVKSGNYPVTYRTLNEYICLFKMGDYKLVENVLAYKIPRFASIIDKFYKPPISNLKFALFISTILSTINKLLGEPKWLMKKDLRKAVESGNMQGHYFSVYKRES